MLSGQDKVHLLKVLECLHEATAEQLAVLTGFKGAAIGSLFKDLTSPSQDDRQGYHLEKVRQIASRNTSGGLDKKWVWRFVPALLRNATP